MSILWQDDCPTSIPSIETSKPKPPILVFDSGVGGLSIYREIQQILPDIRYIYAFDNSAFPYGEKSEEFIIERVLGIVSTITRQTALSLVIIACNSASTVTLPTLRACFDFPIVGVVPAIKPAVCLTRNGIIGLLATRGTINRSYTHELIMRFASKCKIEMLGSSELVELAEAKLHGKPVTLDEIKNILQPWLTMTEPPDTIVLGCTHFPLLNEELQQVLPQGTRLVDSGGAIARRVMWLLNNMPSMVLSTESNLVYCTTYSEKTAQLLPVFKHYGFKQLKQLKQLAP